MSAPTPTGSLPKLQWRHRIPKSLRQHWKLPVVFVVFVVVVATVFGAVRVRPYITGDPTVISSEITENIAGTVDLFDASVTHEVSLEIDQAEYDEMIAAYQNDGEKQWVVADVVIDGTRIDEVGVRLKGNSTLRGLAGEGGSGGPGGFGPPEGFELPEGFALPEGFDPAQGPAGMDMAQVDPEDPTSLPLLLRFDKFVEGRAYQGMTELSVRPGAPVINEAMALSLTAETGQPTQRYGYAVYTVNDSPTATRLVLEHPDEQYANSLFDSPGYLYKADASSRFEYVGDDQSDYAEQFKQINAADSGTLQPIIDFLKWLDSADDAEFDAHLADWVDVESFARYVATQNLLVNFDDMAGPGQNYYLWYDLDTKKLSVVSWDLNLALQGSTTAGPDDSISMGFGMGPGGMGQGGPGQDTAAGDAVGDDPAVAAEPPAQDGTAPPALPEDGSLPAMPPTGGMPPGGAAPGGMPPAGMPGMRPGGPGGPGRGLPQGMPQQQDAQGTQAQGETEENAMPQGMPGGMPPGMPGGDGEGRGPGGGNTLKTRFLDSDAFTEIYHQAYWDLYEQIYGNGTALEVLDRLSGSVPTSDGLTAEALQTDVDEMRTWIEQRTQALSELRTR